MNTKQKSHINHTYKEIYTNFKIHTMNTMNTKHAKKKQKHIKNAHHLSKA